MWTGGVVGAATAILALGGVDAASKSFKDISKGLTTGPDSKHKTTGGKIGITKVSASIKCTSDAYASSYGFSKDSYIEAVADVVKDVCDPWWKGTTKEATDKMFGFALAWAKTTAETAAECTSVVKGGGKAEGCGYGSASAEAFEVAFAEAHASATAEAFATYCSCDDAEAWAFGDADLFIKLVAEAYSAAESTACATETQISTASASVECQALIFAGTFARAAAKATVKGKCYWNRPAEARAEIEAKVDSLILDVSKCTVKEDKTGLSGNETQKKAKTKSKSRKSKK